MLSTLKPILYLTILAVVLFAAVQSTPAKEAKSKRRTSEASTITPVVEPVQLDTVRSDHQTKKSSDEPIEQKDQIVRRNIKDDLENDDAKEDKKRSDKKLENDDTKEDKKRSDKKSRRRANNKAKMEKESRKRRYN